MTRQYNKTKWTQAQLIGWMLDRGWKPLPSPGLWIHATGGNEVNLNAIMKDGRCYWEQFAERQQTPPTEPVPF